MRSIGHHEAMAELVRQHDDERPYAPENGHPLAFAPGGRVTFVNDYGVRLGTFPSSSPQSSPTWAMARYESTRRQ